MDRFERMQQAKPKRTRYTFYIDPDLLDALKRIKERDGISESEQIRRALVLWSEQKGAMKLKRRP